MVSVTENTSTDISNFKVKFIVTYTSLHGRIEDWEYCSSYLYFLSNVLTSSTTQIRCTECDINPEKKTPTVTNVKFKLDNPNAHLK